jgi:hypothetical protein
METRPFFVAGDLASNVLVGALVGGVLALLFGPGWNMFIAMVVGMVLGMVVSLPFAFLLGALFGAMETMLPVMTTGMLAGMVVSMAAAMAASAEAVGFAHGAWLGCLSGFGIFVATYLANAVVKPRAARWTK